MNITEDKVKAYGLIALGALGVYIVYKAVKTGQDAVTSVSDSLHRVGDAIGGAVSSVTDILPSMSAGHIDQNALPRNGDIAHPAIVTGVPSTPESVYHIPPSVGMGDYIIGLDSTNAGRFSAGNQTSNLSPNAFQAMTDNYANINIDLTGFNGGDA